MMLSSSSEEEESLEDSSHKGRNNGKSSNNGDNKNYAPYEAERGQESSEDRGKSPKSKKPRHHLRQRGGGAKDCPPKAVTITSAAAAKRMGTGNACTNFTTDKGSDISHKNKNKSSSGGDGSDNNLIPQFDSTSSCFSLVPTPLGVIPDFCLLVH